MENESKPFTSIGGQAVIEGVMMRSPKYMTVAVRQSDGKIVVRGERIISWSERLPFLKTPFIRGITGLFEMMILGMKALNFSATISEPEAESKSVNSYSAVLSMIIGIGLALLLFVAMPHALSAWVLSLMYPGLESKALVDLPAFHALDGLLKLTAMILYIVLISRIPEIKRVFQYHGAEHKSIYAFESGKDLRVENAQAFRTQHPRCGTSFLFFLIFIGFAIFSIFFPLAGIQFSSENVVLAHLTQILIKMGLMLPIAGISYEVIKWSARHQDRFIMKVVMAPGLWVQNLTTKQPDDSQVEVALAALKKAIYLEKTQAILVQPEMTYAGGLSEIQGIAASVQEFAEA